MSLARENWLGQGVADILGGLSSHQTKRLCSSIPLLHRSHRGLPSSIFRDRPALPAHDPINTARLAWLAAQPLTGCTREQVTIALTMIEALDAQLAPLDTNLRAYARRHPGRKALIAAHYGIGPLVAVTILAELGDCRRFSSSREAVRYAGIDITVYASDRRRAPARLSRQGPPALRWALFEAAQCARRRSSPDHPYYLETAERLGGNRACLAVSRKLLKRSSTRYANSARKRCKPHDLATARQALRHPDAPRPAPGKLLPPPARGRPSSTERPQRLPQRDHPPSNIMSPARSQPPGRGPR